MRNKDNVFWGLICLLAAGFIIWNHLWGDIDIPVIRTAIGIVCIVGAARSLGRLDFGGVFFPLAIVGILFDDELGITDLTPWPILAVAILCTVGMDLIFKNRKWDNKIARKEKKLEKKFGDNMQHGMDGEKVRVSSKFGSVIKYIHSDRFESAYLECKFGGMEVYFDDAIMAGTQAEVVVDVSFGGLTLYIPRTWRVENEISSTFGGVDASGRNISTPESNMLILRGTLEFSGLEIIYI